MTSTIKHLYAIDLSNLNNDAKGIKIIEQIALFPNDVVIVEREDETKILTSKIGDIAQKRFIIHDTNSITFISILEQDSYKLTAFIELNNPMNKDLRELFDGLILSEETETVMD